MNKTENHQWDENKVNHYDKRKIHHLDEKVFNWMKKFISLVEIKSSIGWNKIYLLDIIIFSQLDENKIHQLDETKIHHFAEPKNPYFDERNLHNLEATVKYQFGENLYSSIG